MNQAEVNQARADHEPATIPDAIACRLDEQALVVDGNRIPVPTDGRLIAVTSWADALGRSGDKKRRHGIAVEAQSNVPARLLVRLLLSAARANIPRAHLFIGEGIWLELAVPNQPTVPPFTASDLFVTVQGDAVQLSRDIGGLGEDGNPSAQPNDSGTRQVERHPDRSSDPTARSPSQLVARFRRECAEAPCDAAALLVDAAESWGALRPVLAALQSARGERGTLRLVVADSRPTSQRTPPALSREQVETALVAAKNSFETCRQEAQGRSVTNRGTIQVRFVVSGLGIVFDVDAVPDGSTIGDPLLRRCVADAVRRVRFPRPANDSPIEYLIRL